MRIATSRPLQIGASQCLVSFTRSPFFIGIRVGPHLVKLKTAEQELFSERYGYAKVWRVFGLSLVYLYSPL